MEGAVRSAADAQRARIEEPWGSLTWLASRTAGNARDLTIGRVIIKPGMSNPRHCHMASEEILYLLRGKLEHAIGEQTYVLEAGDTITIPGGVPHQAANIGEEEADMIVAYPTGNRDFVPA